MKTLREMMDLIESAQTVAEMDSQGHTGTRDDYEKDRKYKGPVGTGKSVTPKKVVKDLSKDFEKSFAKEKQVKKKGVKEGHADQQRKVFKKNGKPVGEIGTDPEASPGNGNWYVKHYASGYDVVGFDNAEEALAELKHCVKQGVAEESLEENEADPVRRVEELFRNK